MTSQANAEMIKILAYVLIPIVITIIVLTGVLVYIYFKNKYGKNEKKEKIASSSNNENTAIQNKQSIFKFMEFDTVRDNMIVQKNGKRYLMVIGCQGINYDLMSKMEKTSVEQGFVQFLNTLRHQIQIYIQTRSINLESSLEGYRERVREVEDKYRKMQLEYERMKESGDYSDEELQKSFFELTKQNNLYEYGKSILQDTEKMSLNRNILSQKYYLIVPYYSAEAGNEKLDRREIDEVAFSELYTRAQSLIGALSVCGVRGKILRNNELIELLYMAYNRDEAETFGLDKALKAGFDEMYSTAPDVLRKRMKELDKIIEEKAIEMARQKVDEARSEIELQIEDKEDNMEDLISEMAKLIIEENEDYLGKEVKEKAEEKIEEEKAKNTKVKKGGRQNGKKTTTRRSSATA